ncbi:MAG: glycoside hydrolase family 3 protein [Treponema sp.]|nr:glycoside hydrolase family 3 protein [Treponema sp.]
MKKYLFWLLCGCLVCLCACRNQKKINQKELLTHQRGRDALEYINLVEQQRDQAVWDYIAALTPQDRIAQLFVVNLVGCDTFVPVEESIAGGFLYFAYNIAESPEAQSAFNKSIIEYCRSNNKIPPFLTVDQEGGYVNRMQPLNGPLPSAQRVSTILTTQKAGELYTLQAKQMKALGFTMNLAPVAEVCTADNEIFLNQRSFGDLETVIDYGTVCIQAYESNGIGTVLKHFPGNTNTDPHTGLPEIKWTQAEFDMQMASFKTLLEQKPAAILMSHARVKGYDEALPACLSKYWVTDVLRNKFGYEGIIFSDDIFMGALADNGYPSEQAVVMAIEAGIDCIIISEKRIMESVEVLINKAAQDEQFDTLLNTAVRRMIDYKIKSGMLYVHLDDSGKYVLSADYEGCMSNDPSVFAGLKQQNRQFYMDNFYGK